MFIIKNGRSLSSACFKIAALATISISSLFSEGFVLTVSPERAEIIEEIVTTMSETNVILLKFKETELRELSKNLKGMGSLNFLGFIFTHSNFLEHLRVIADSSWKFNGFMGSVRKGFDREKANGSLWIDIPGFAELLSVDAAKLVKFANKSQWDELVQYLVETVR